MIARSDTHIAETFKATTVELAGDLCHASRPLLPVFQGRMLRVDELCVTSGLERQSPLAATVMALGPAVAAAGSSVALIGWMSPEQAIRLAGVAEGVVDVAIEALDALETLREGGEANVAFAHGLAHATHLASALAAGPVQPRDGSGRGGHPPRAPALWPTLLASLSIRIAVKRHWKDAPGLAGWTQRIDAASACRDAAVHSMRAHGVVTATRAEASRERLLRCLTFASLYCGFAMLERPPWAGPCPTARTHSAVDERGPVPVQVGRRLVYPFRPGGQGAVALT
ncbi:MAG: hypothetical protein ABR950_06340 [Candidatus Dormibacteria bacterium]|jgi:hypothetical protein